ncbi:MAG: DUF362 domain-containing protein [Deltaproteobacteria bacterium]|nr:DUF362 domain-containing protein [Deltaproteobacteria bacterium]
MSTSESRVFLIPLDTSETDDRTAFSLETVLAHRAYHLMEAFSDSELVGVKLPYIEDKNQLNADLTILKALVNSLRKAGKNPFVCDTSSRHIDKKANAVEHMEIYHRKGISYETAGASFAMLDGISGGYEFVDTSPVDKSKVFLAGELPNIDGLIIFSTPSPSGSSCCKGSIFNMGIGLASRKGKIQLYSKSGPQVNAKQCYLCRKCIYICPCGAISRGEKHVIINYDKCINCGKCVDLTRFGGISYKWDTSRDEFMRKMHLNARSVQNLMGKRLLFCHLIKKSHYSGDIPCNSEEFSFKQAVLVSRDPVAIDQATMDLFSEDPGFDPGFNSESLDQAVEMGLGKRKFKLIPIAY